jgi:Ca2+-binding RTX toxin-like protein
VQTVAANVRLVLGTGAIEGVIGGSGDDLIKGNGLANEFYSGKGNDTLSGGGGSDLFHYGEFYSGPYLPSLSSDRTSDTILDFAVGQDKIVLSKTVFSNITSGVGAALGSNFAVVASDALVGSSSAAIVYSLGSHKLFSTISDSLPGTYNATALNELAYFSNNASLTAADFIVTA